jgi:RimJ/RimL family protein N-acetyltransferase
MPKITLRPTIPADLPHVIGEPLPCRIRAVTALADDRVIGLGGIAFPPHGPAIAFVQLAPPPEDGAGVPEARRYPVAFHRAGLAAMAMMRASGVAQVVATADAGNAAAVRWLKRLGFEETERQDIAGRLLFVWNAPPASQP